MAIIICIPLEISFFKQLRVRSPNDVSGRRVVPSRSIARAFIFSGSILTLIRLSITAGNIEINIVIFLIIVHGKKFKVSP